ncbi:hypothetical protein FGB62_20g13 [Gracilaria domingensis]|nr:hypothetical protein FGB62_20g13 [Gracilaria domingensis]
MASSEEDTLQKARELEKAVQRDNDIIAMVQLARLLLYDDNFVSQRDRGVQMLERAIKQGQSPGAMFSLACYLKRFKNDHRRAFLLFERSLKLCEHPDVIRELGNCYLYGEGVLQDCNVAVQLFERAFRLKRDPSFMVTLANSLLHAPDYRRQKCRAISLYRDAIRLSSDGRLMNGLGILYDNGTCNLSPSREQALKWYSRAIETSKLPASMYNKAVLILNHNPSTDDVQEAIRLLEDALDLGNEENTIVKLADTYLEYDINLERAAAISCTLLLGCPRGYELASTTYHFMEIYAA